MAKIMTCPICKKNTNIIISKKLRTGEPRKVFYCKNCQLGILDSNISADDLEKFYSEEYRSVGKPKLDAQSDTAELFSIYSRFQGERLKLLKPYMTKKTKLLEVGCSAGMFLYHAKDLVKEVVGIDFDKASAEFAAKKCNCMVYTTNIKDTPLKKKYFDLIVAFQTLEHVKDPELFINEIKEYLAPGGTLAIEVPNLFDSLAHVYDLPFHRQFFFHAAHLWYFTQKSLEKVLGKAGFKGKVTHTQDYNFLNHINWIIHDKPQSNPLFGLSAPALPFKKDSDRKTAKRIADFAIEADQKYKKLLADLKITSNIIFIGKIK